MNEILNPSPTMLLVFIVALITIVLGVQNRRNRRRLANLAYDENMVDEEDDDSGELDEEEFDFDLPDALGSEDDFSEDEFEIEFDDDDIELLE